MSDDSDSSSDTTGSAASADTTGVPATTEAVASDTTATAGSVDSTTEAAASDTTPTTEAVADFRTVEHELGTSEIPTNPERVVVLDRPGTLPFLLEMGVEPVGALEAGWLFGGPFHPLVSERAAALGVEPIDGSDGPNLEQIAALERDLIIGNVRDMFGTEDLLAGIAPTVGLQWDFAKAVNNAINIGAMLGLEDEVQVLVDDFQTALDDATSNTDDPGTVSIIGLFGPDDIRIYRSLNLFGQLTEELGGQVVPTEDVLPINPGDGEVNNTSLEEISLASGDRITSFVNVSPESIEGYTEAEQQPLIQALPAFQNDLVLHADPQLAFGAAGSTGVQEILNQLVEFYNS